MFMWHFQKTAGGCFFFIFILLLVTYWKIYITKITHIETETEQVIWCLLCSDHKDPFLSTLCDISLGIDLLKRPSRRWAHTLYTPCSVFFTKNTLQEASSGSIEVPDLAESATPAVPFVRMWSNADHIILGAAKLLLYIISHCNIQIFFKFLKLAVAHILLHFKGHHIKCKYKSKYQPVPWITIKLV